MSWQYTKERTNKGERIGGGFIVMRRGKKTGRVSVRVNPPPFEHPTFDAAQAEAARLARAKPGETFSVWQECDGSAVSHLHRGAPAGEGKG